MELLVIKTGKGYVRVGRGDYSLCGLERASVFPMDELDTVRGHVQRLRERNYGTVSINRLIMREEPFDDQEKQK
ncbi:MAG: hypothetical protein JRF51_14710 [Deltaproteobacteria bacterium]|nr:hypothetical protein [Deltaproteobacteria bacterium]MBW2354457.1 hypothetical protein [Deltaproteobacteria bacterium]